MRAETQGQLNRTYTGIYLHYLMRTEFSEINMTPNAEAEEIVRRLLASTRQRDAPCHLCTLPSTNTQPDIVRVTQHSAAISIRQLPDKHFTTNRTSVIPVRFENGELSLKS